MKVKADAVNQRMDKEAREKARGEQIFVEVVRGVNSSLGRRKAESLFVLLIVYLVVLHLVLVVHCEMDRLVASD